jgi:pSer/pThr/pTyr-binding forkhead associated (FHA) protein
MSFFRKIFSAAGVKIKRPARDGRGKNAEEGTDQIDGRTKVFVRVGKIPEQKKALPALLKVVSGQDAGLEIPLASRQVNIGRRADNEVPLTDISVSRLHAFIVSENGSHVLYDGKSANGTFLNNQRINQKTLRHGDMIKIGNTVIAYELR